MKTRVYRLLWGLSLILISSISLLTRPSAQVVSAPVPLAAMPGVQVFSGAPQGDQKVYFTRQQLLQGGLMQVSVQHPLPCDFPAPNARGIQAVVGHYIPASPDAALDRAVIQALCDMRLAHSLDGMRITRGAVSSAQQNALRREAFARFSQVTSLEQAAALSRQQIPAGGESEHQLGTAFDLELTGTLEMGKHDLIAQSEEGLWLRDNMWRWGFIRRYGPAHAGSEEGICENLHLRYVGRCHAAAMEAGKWCLEEYLALLRIHGALTLRMEGQADVYIYCIPDSGGDGMAVMLPSVNAQGSLDNTGWALFWCSNEALSPG